jgi:CRISPR type IV-associated protein Csf2
MAATLSWDLALTATSSISHSGVTRGTTTLFRRETVIQPDGRAVEVPIVSGNSFRGRLRRIGEELLRDTLRYEGELALSAAHALRGGGSLAKTSGDPLSGRRLHTLRALIPHVGVFGCAAGGRIIDGCLQVGKVVPHLRETAHILDHPRSDLSSFSTAQIETYMRHDDTDSHAFTDVTTHRVDVDPTGQPRLEQLPDHDTDTSQLMQFHVETLPAGAELSSWLRLERATDLEVAFFTDVLEAFTAYGRLGGRAAIGHGHVRTIATRTQLAGTEPTPVDWRAHLTERRDEALAALATLT